MLRALRASRIFGIHYLVEIYPAPIPPRRGAGWDGQVLLSVIRDLPLVLMSDLPEYGLVLMRFSVLLGYNVA